MRPSPLRAPALALFLFVAGSSPATVAAQDAPTDDAPTDAIAEPAPDADVHPTLDEIFNPPRLLGQRPSDLGLSADGRWITWRWTAEDAEEPEPDLHLTATDGGATEVLATHDEDVDVLWTRAGAVLLRERDGWIDRVDVDGDRTPVPLFEGARLRDVELLDDDRHALVRADPDDQLYLVDLATGARSTPAARLRDRSRWSQVLGDGEAVALFAAPEDADDAGDDDASEDDASTDDARVLWLVGLRTGEATATPVEEADGLTVSADGRWAVSRAYESTVDRELVMADYLTEQVTMVPVRNSLAGDDASRVEVELHDVATGESVPLPLDGRDRFHLRELEWSPTGHRLLVDRVSNDVHVRQVLVFDPEARSGTSFVVCSDRDDAWVGGPTQWSSWSDDGAWVLFTSERSGFNHVYRARPDGSELTALTEGAWEVQRVERLEDHGRLLVAGASPDDPTVRQLRLVDVETGAQQVLTGDDGCALAGGWSRRDPGRPRVSRDGSTLVYTWETLGRPGDLHALRLPATLGDPLPAPVRLTDVVPDALDELDLVQPEVITYENPDDGATVHALLYLPEPYDPTVRHPLVVFVHGAGYLQNVTRSRTFYDVDKLFHHRLARRGYVVLAPDFRHSAGYGRDFRADIHGYMGGKDTDDVVAGVRHLERMGLVDPTKVGVYGGSYGGFLTLMCLARYPDVFSAGAALRSVTDWRTYHAGYTNPRLGSPEDDPENYERSSPIDLVADIEDPVLMLHGMKDDNVFAQDSIRFIEELIQLGKEFDAMLYPSQAHGFTDPESWVDEYRRIERYMDRWVRR